MLLCLHTGRKDQLEPDSLPLAHQKAVRAHGYILTRGSLLPEQTPGPRQGCRRHLTVHVLGTPASGVPEAYAAGSQSASVLWLLVKQVCGWW